MQKALGKGVRFSMTNRSMNYIFGQPVQILMNDMDVRIITHFPV